MQFLHIFYFYFWNHCNGNRTVTVATVTLTVTVTVTVETYSTLTTNIYSYTYTHHFYTDEMSEFIKVQVDSPTAKAGKTLSQREYREQSSDPTTATTPNKER